MLQLRWIYRVENTLSEAVGILRNASATRAVNGARRAVCVFVCEAMAVMVHHQFSSGLAVITVAAACDKFTVRVDPYPNVFPIRRPSRIAFPNIRVGLGKERLDGPFQFRESHILFVLQSNGQVFKDKLAAALFDDHQEFTVRALAPERSSFER